MRISDWSSDVCSSDLFAPLYAMAATGVAFLIVAVAFSDFGYAHDPLDAVAILLVGLVGIGMAARWLTVPIVRSEEHTSELQSLMRISYAVFCLKKKNKLT